MSRGALVLSPFAIRSIVIDRFVPSFRKPDDCMDRVIRAIADRHYKKGRGDDLLRTQITPSGARRAELLRRCPDLERLLRALG